MNRSALIKEICKGLLAFAFSAIGIWAICEGKPAYEAVVDAMPVFFGYYQYTLGSIAIVTGALAWLMLDHLDNISQINRLERRIEELETEWKEADLGDDEDETGYARCPDSDADTGLAGIDGDDIRHGDGRPVMVAACLPDGDGAVMDAVGAQDRTARKD